MILIFGFIFKIYLASLDTSFKRLVSNKADNFDDSWTVKIKVQELVSMVPPISIMKNQFEFRLNAKSVNLSIADSG